ncbi:MAG: alpha/beta hydrolase-fold protein [Myxococcota bacterium]
MAPTIPLGPTPRAGLGPFCCLVLFVAACGGDGDPASPDVVEDVSPDAASDVHSDIAAGGDADVASPDAPEDVEADPGSPDAAHDGEADTAPDVPERRWAHRSIGGISMGAAALNIALRHPEEFDVVGALGGYVDLPYMVSTALRLQLSGFCPLETLEASPDDLDDPDAEPPVFCGPAQPEEDLEVAQDFNHLHYDTNGATFHRGFYMRVFQSLTMAFGNFTSEPTGASPYLPTGLTLDWLTGTPPSQRCDAAPIAEDLSYNAEYNPEAAYPVIPVCDSTEQVTEGLDGADFDPAVEHTNPTDVLLAVDVNGNGERDYAEPLFFNAHERYDDVGADGCPNDREDGAGGCLAEGEVFAGGPDPNGDDFHWWDNPAGTEGNHWRDEGEPFRDRGLDGVADTGDPGEGNGAYDMTSAFERAEQFDATTLMAQLPAEQRERMDFYFDSGIRDPLHAAVSTRHVVGRLKATGADVRHYRGMAGREGALFSDHDMAEVLDAAVEVDMSPEGIGRHVYVEYGDPDATPEQIEAGDGGHVGTNEQAIARIVSFLVFGARRLPQIDEQYVGGGMEPSEYHHFYSEGLGARRGYTIALPPGYYRDAEADVRYPVLYFLHGLGQEASDLAPATIATSSLMDQGAMPEVIVVFPDGACCYVHEPTGRRECACRKGPDHTRICIDPDCEGDEDSCEERAIPRSELTEECNGGSLYFDLVSNRWGEPRDDLKYAASVMELVEAVDARFRTQLPDTE